MLEWVRGSRGLPGRRASNGRLEPPQPGRAFKKTECGCLSLLCPHVSGVRWARLHLRTEDSHLAARTASVSPPRLPRAPLPALQPLSVQPVRSPPTRLSPCLSVGPSSPRSPPVLARPPACLCFPFPSVPPSLRPSSSCLCFHLSVCLSCPYLPPTCLSTHLSTCPSVRFSVFPSTLLSFIRAPSACFTPVWGGRSPCGAEKLTASGPVKVWQWEREAPSAPRCSPGTQLGSTLGRGGRRRDPADLRGGGTPGQFLSKERLWPLWRRRVTAAAPSPAAEKPQRSSVKFSAQAPTHSRGGGVSPCPGFLSCQRGLPEPTWRAE